MRKWKLLEQVKIADDLLMTLHESGGEYALRVGGRELMSSRHVHSEEELAVVACASLRSAPNPCVLIGGLGLGFTLRAALRELPASAKVVVAELLPEVVAWNRNPTYQLASDALADSRTEVVISDVGDLIGNATSEFDAIMLDADNETTAMNTSGNAGLYGAGGLARVFRALRPKGTVVYWAAGAEPKLEVRLNKAGFRTEVRRIRAHATSGGTHFLIIARRAG